MYRRITTLVLATGLLLLPAFARAEVLDRAGFFSSDAVTKANETIRELKSKFGHEVRIETYAAVPEGKSQSVAGMTAKERDTFFSSWIQDRAEATKSRGLLVLICKEPSHLRLWAGNPLQRAGFGAAQAKSIRETLLTDFKAKQYDKALSNSLGQVRSTFAGLSASPGRSVAGAHRDVSTPNAANPAHPPRAVPQERQAPQATGFGFGGFIWIIAIVIGAILVISLISRMFGGNRPSYGQAGYGQPGYPGGGGGGGGFLQSLTGGIFGAMAGHWLYDQFSGHHGQAHAGESNWHGQDQSHHQDDGGFSGGTDFGGGDYGGGGGDFGGGGDSGGGDF